MGVMQKHGSFPVRTRLHRPTLPSKNMIIVRKLSQDKACPPLGQHFSLSQDDAHRFAKNDEGPMPPANFVSEAPSDDEKNTPSSSNSSVSEELTEEPEPTKMHSAQAKRSTGVYVNNVEIRSEMHPLQCCSAKRENSPLQQVTLATLASGRPLSAAPKLPRCQSGLKPISLPTGKSLHSPKRTRPFTTFESTFKKQRLSQDSRVPRISQPSQAKPSRAAQVKEASFMLEAAVALANLHGSKVC